VVKQVKLSHTTRHDMRERGRLPGCEVRSALGCAPIRLFQFDDLFGPSSPTTHIYIFALSVALQVLRCDCMVIYFILLINRRTDQSDR
jgi:hypothetical protein